MSSCIQFIAGGHEHPQRGVVWAVRNAKAAEWVYHQSSLPVAGETVTSLAGGQHLPPVKLRRDRSSALPAVEPRPTNRSAFGVGNNDPVGTWTNLFQGPDAAGSTAVDDEEWESVTPAAVAYNPEDPEIRV